MLDTKTMIPRNGWFEKQGVRTHYVNGIVHHDSEPAITDKFNGIAEWRHHGKRHRLDGPAVVQASFLPGGSSRRFHTRSQQEQWWVRGRRLTVTSIKEYACEMFPEHDPASAVLAYIVFEGLPLDIEQTLQALETRTCPTESSPR